ncbi:uncharacterized protein CDV56_105847 [Aspergillus thermomutatus]|uniref:Uncharacterized protein n=1 Tax=Aspergillus thermomutatus TaxID=41047 RepID=A0A397HST2_ASPTH|nr:uncharacterized protein CDV56_105847 [Aspergillus thermomutatus]RHZ63590.1 hypothetical protein CDV56_105847 [Aspergillus thermomutatus]
MGSWQDVADIKSQLLACKEKAEDAGEISIVRVNDYKPEALDILAQCIPGFPTYMVENVAYNATSGQNLAIIPGDDRTSGDLRFLLTYPFVDTSVANSGSNKAAAISVLPIAIWICPSSILGPATGQVGANARKMIFVIGTSPRLQMRLATYYSKSHTARLHRLRVEPLWVIVDLLHVFAEWGPVWNHARRELVMCHSQIHNYPDTPPLLELTRRMHGNTSKVISLREQLRIHSSALARSTRLVQSSGSHSSKDDLLDHIQGVMEDITYQEEEDFAESFRALPSNAAIYHGGVPLRRRRARFPFRIPARSPAESNVSIQSHTV